MASSPYVSDDNRLGDVIAAIQAMGTYKSYKLDFANWADRVSGDTGDADHWEAVFRQHPEFFRLDANREKASLVWRRQHQKRFSTKNQKQISSEAFYALSDEEKSNVSRAPLSPDEINTLIQTAIQLHSSVLKRREDRRWWLSGTIVLVGAIVGTALSFLF